jgi:Flp pilus assembly protein CpaB
MRKIFLIVGALLAAMVAAGIFLLWRQSQPRVYEIPVALADIPAGTVLRSTQFKIARWSNLDSETLDRFITVDEFAQADGKVTLTEIRAGYPVAVTQIDPASNAESETRLSVIISGTKTSYAVIPVTPDMIGNYVQPGDRVDVMLSLGDINLQDYELGPDGEMLIENKARSGNNGSGQLVEVLMPPFNKVVLQNMKVLRVDREIPRENNDNQNANNAEAQRQREIERRKAEVKRLYVEVTRDQLEVLTFAVNFGKRTVSVRAATADGVIEPTEGVTWNDFVRWFYIQRNKTIKTDSLRNASPYQPAPSSSGQ